MDAGTGASSRVLVVDAEGQILGRLASRVAKLLLEGHKVVIVNAEKALLSGDPKMVVEGYKKMFEVQTYRNPERQGIRRERSPERIVKSAVRGMLPVDKHRGRMALKSLAVYAGVPRELAGTAKIKFPEADASRLRCKAISVGELARQLGWRG